MRLLYLIIALDKLNGHVFNPDPCLFETEEEAQLYIKNHDSKSVSHAYKLARVGKMKQK